MSPPGRQQIAAVTVPLAGVAAAAIRAADTAPGPGRGCLMAVLVLSALVTGLQRRRRDCPAGVAGIWELAAIVLAPPLFAFTVPAAAAAIACRPARRLACAPGMAAAGLTDGAVSAAFHAAVAAPPLPGTQGGEWLLAVAAAGVLRQVLACAVARLAACGEPPSAAADGRELARGGLAELCAAVLVTCSAVLSPLCVLLAVPLATPLLRSLLHAQLARDARTDRKTGLLNAAAWQEAAALRSPAPSVPAFRWPWSCSTSTTSRRSTTPTATWPGPGAARRGRDHHLPTARLRHRRPVRR